MKINPFSPKALEEAVQVLRSGGVVVHPADTCFGLAADAFNKSAFEKVLAIKGRDFNKPMSVMISVAQTLKMEQYVQLNDFSRMVADRLFPSPVTLLLPKGPAIPDWYFPETDLIGLRVPLHDMTQDLLTAFDGPLITTSANPSGQALCFKCEEVVTRFAERDVQPDLIFDGSCKEYNQASTVIRVEKNHVKVVRQGPLTASQLEGILGVRVR